MRHHIGSRALRLFPGTRNSSTLTPRLVTLALPSKSSLLTSSHNNAAYVARLQLSNETGRNAFSAAMLFELKEGIKAVQRISESDAASLRVLIVESTIKRIFCAGADLKERLKMKPDEVEDFVSELRNTLHELSNLSIPTIAKVSGAALGGGAELALACDIRIADSSESAATKIGLPETKLAIIPGAGGTQRLARLVGLSRAKDLIFTGRHLDAKEAHNIGLVDYVTDGAEETERRVMDMALEICERGPVAIKWAKKAINGSLSVSIEEGLAYEKQCYSQLLNTKDRIEGLVAFSEKRAPKYSGS